jgi:hypothetical protein
MGWAFGPCQTTATEKADSSASLRNDKQKNVQRQEQKQIPFGDDKPIKRQQQQQQQQQRQRQWQRLAIELYSSYSVLIKMRWMRHSAG